jgi:hypothetical protein
MQKQPIFYQCNIIVTFITFPSFFMNLINYPLFYCEVVYWVGLIANTVALLLSITFLIKGGCVQGCFYEERYRDRDQVLKKVPADLIEFE